MEKEYYINLFKYASKWLFISLVIALLSGFGSFVFLFLLDWVTNERIQNQYYLYYLPFAGLFIGLVYHYYGKDSLGGNNTVIEEAEHPQKIISYKMAPLVLITTIITHLVGGSAGREGTAIQMSASLSDQLNKLFKFSDNDRKGIIKAAIAGGFASVFGTPLAGALFALELTKVGKINYSYLFPITITAILSHYFCMLFGAKHTAYLINFVPELTLNNFLWVVFCGILFGMAAIIYVQLSDCFSKAFIKLISYAPLRPFFGGIVLLILFLIFDLDIYQGLGIETIVNSFSVTQSPAVFILKILLTTFTLSAGFKGGEVTPLFFIGATLGSALFIFVPLPVSLLAGLGFMAVFAGCTNTPLACTMMGIELFGAEAAVFLAIACVVAYLVSGKHSIYVSQNILHKKNSLIS